jgi:hypothetical protein
MSNKNNKNYFPPQKKLTRDKTDKWMKECVEAGVSLTESSTEDGVRTSRLNKQINKDLSNGIIDPVDMYKISNPFSIDGFDRHIQDYPLARPRINLLTGEESLRSFEPTARVINQDAVQEKEEAYMETLINQVKEVVLGFGYDEQKVEQKLADIDRWMIYEYKDIRERMANQLIQAYRHTMDLDMKFNIGIEDAIVQGEEIYCVDVMAGGRMDVRRIEPLNLYTYRQEPGFRIDDADVIVEDGYHSVGYVIDYFYDELSDKDITDIENGSNGAGSPTRGRVLNYSENSNTNILDTLIEINDNGNLPTNSSKRPFSENGRVRVTRVVWKSLRKIGELSIPMPDGTVEKQYVDEHFKPNAELGQEVKWIWVGEWWEGTRIGEDKYVKMGPRPIQYRVDNNQSINSSGYVGTSYGVSMMDLMRPYQYLYDEFMDRVKRAFAKFKGPMIELDFAKMPDEWEPEKWMHYAEDMGYLIIDSFKASTEGASAGLIAGNFNTTNKAINPDMGNYIQHHINMLEYIERQIGVITGINQQRLGEISSSETVGGVERAVRQSNHMTEKMYKLHDHTKLRVIQLVIDTARHILKGQKLTMQYMLDDITAKFIEIDGNMLNTVELGIAINDASSDAALYQDLKALAQAGLQNNKINYTQLIDIYTSKGIASMRRKLELAERDADERERAAGESQQKAAQAAEAASTERFDKELAQKERESIRKAETELAIKDMEIGSKAKSEQLKLQLDSDKATIDKEQKDRQLRLAEQAQKETSRHNMQAESISRLKKNSPK